MDRNFEVIIVLLLPLDLQMLSDQPLGQKVSLGLQLPEIFPADRTAFELELDAFLAEDVVLLAGEDVPRGSSGVRQLETD